MSAPADPARGGGAANPARGGSAANPARGGSAANPARGGSAANPARGGGAANPERGEAALRVNGTELVLRPSFQALVAAEGELGPLFELVERAASGRLTLHETATLFWHCLREVPETVTREALGEALAALGLSRLAPVLAVLLRQIVAGR